MARQTSVLHASSHSKYVALMSFIVVIILAYLVHQAHMDVLCAADTYLSVSLVTAPPTADDGIRVRITTTLPVRSPRYVIESLQHQSDSNTQGQRAHSLLVAFEKPTYDDYCRRDDEDRPTEWAHQANEPGQLRTSRSKNNELRRW